MKVYIATYHDAINFGAQLQSYALQQILKDIGYDSELIAIKKGAPIKDKRIKSRIKRILNSIYNFRYKSNVKRAVQLFENFAATHHKTTKVYDSFEQLKNNPPKGDVIYLSGSDQVFNPIAMKPEFFLQFGDKTIKRISYAASIAVNTVPKDKENVFKRYISDFNEISIREKDSVSLMKKYTDKRINVNIDPCLLIDKSEWTKVSNEKIIDRLKGKPYVLVYTIYRADWLNKQLKQIKKQTGWEIVQVSNGGLTRVYNDVNIIDAGPSEFLGLVKNAQMVVSSSYHGCVFAQVYRKPFYAVLNPDAPGRIKSMLELFGLENRILNESDNIILDTDYAYMEKKLKDEQKKSLHYLKTAIEGKNEV